MPFRLSAPPEFEGIARARRRASPPRDDVRYDRAAGSALIGKAVGPKASMSDRQLRSRLARPTISPISYMSSANFGLARQ